MGKKYMVKCWIPVEIEDRLNGILLTKDEAQYELEHQEMMQPENKYEIIEVEDAEEGIAKLEERMEKRTWREQLESLEGSE